MLFLKPKNKFQYLIQNIFNLAFRVLFKVRKYKISKKTDIINGDSFENLSKNKKIIFGQLENFKKITKNKIRGKIIVFHNSDKSFDNFHYEKIHSLKPLKCFSQNMLINRINFYNIPIGFENFKYYSLYGGNDDILQKKIETNHKKNRILYGFNITHNSRRKYLKYLKKVKLCDETKGWNIKIYRKILNKYKFVFCPRGNGFDTHRIWEAFYLNVVPILIKDEFNIFYYNNKFPVILINNIEDLENLNEEKLEKLYKKLLPKFKNKKLNFLYWSNKILK